MLECMERGSRRTYVVEIKHWVSGKKVGGVPLKKFLSVVVDERYDSGLLLSTSGFSMNAFQAITEFEYRRLRVGERAKIVSICQMSARRGFGVWKPQQDLTALLYDGTKEATG